MLATVSNKGVEELSRLSKRAIRPGAQAPREAGLITIDNKVVRLHEGRAGLPAFTAVECAWSQRFDIAALRTALEELVQQLPFELPRYPVSYGAVDLRVTGGPGQDWTFCTHEPVEGCR
ncbi:MAG: hypothetical protein R2911_07010 [Caldilineaceae bacterium]